MDKLCIFVISTSNFHPQIRNSLVLGKNASTQEYWVARPNFFWVEQHLGNVSINFQVFTKCFINCVERHFTQYFFGVKKRIPINAKKVYLKFHTQKNFLGTFDFTQKFVHLPKLFFW